MTKKFISWNIDSLNAALTGSSPRSELSKEVLKSLADKEPD
ncbi:MAG: exodeoxyribonuclease, partial [Streptococcaceae bacterium]|nr:exodeoxyribonuclease [Streptococcaceae bacterium]